jgi:hypothetical protein
VDSSLRWNDGIVGGKIFVGKANMAMTVLQVVGR